MNGVTVDYIVFDAVMESVSDHPVIFEHPLMTQDERDWLLGLASQLEEMEVAGEA